MIPVVLAMSIRGASWRLSIILACSDNMAVVCALSSGSVCWCTFYSAYTFQIVSRAHHIAGVHHSAVNAMSRDKHVFLSCFAQTPCSLLVIPKALLDMLLHTNCNPMSKPFFRQLCRKHPHRMFWEGHWRILLAVQNAKYCHIHFPHCHPFSTWSSTVVRLFSSHYLDASLPTYVTRR